MAIADRIDRGTQSNRYFYCLLGDGELNEGQNWEAFMLGAKEKLHNVIAIIDRNNIQIDGFTEDIMPLNDLRAKLAVFNWHVQEVDGHNFEAIDDAVNQAKAIFSMPSVIIAHTIPGKGVPFMERDYRWHGVPPGSGPEDVVGKREQETQALDALRTLDGKITCGDK
jgi:transketolase